LVYGRKSIIANGCSHFPPKNRRKLKGRKKPKMGMMAEEKATETSEMEVFRRRK
jgi:hypothetical protein